MTSLPGGQAGIRRPLDAVTTIKSKLGLLVAVSVTVATLVGALGAAAGVPLLLVLPVTVALALGVTQLLAAGMVAPLRDMTRVAQQMARGDYTGRVHTPAVDEVGRLAAAFNQMAEDLADVDRERRDLIATVSHELRTPLTAMTATLDNLADGVVPADRDHLAGALAQAERLGALVADLLDLSRLEAGVTRLDPQPVPVARLVDDCVAEVVAARGGGAYAVDVPVDLVVTADPGRLRQLLVNLLDNAHRHTLAGTPVSVSAAATAGGGWSLEVVDQGPGVDPDDRERIFARFGTDAEGGGTGLGLAIARWVAQLHGGTLRFLDPPADASGARVRLDLPAPDTFTVTPSDPTAEEAPMPAPSPASTRTGPAPRTADAPAGAPPGLDALFGGFWREPGGLPGLRVVLLSAAVGVLAGATMAFSLPGLSWTVVLLAAGATAYATARHRADRFALACTALSALLVLPVTLLDNLGVAALCVLAAAAVFLVGVTGGGTLPGFLLAGVAWPLASLRGLPWLGRSLRVIGTGGRSSAVARTVAWSVVGLAVFGALFASADALFARWVDALVPNLTFGDLVLRCFVAAMVFGLTLAAAYLALNPPVVEPRAGAAAPLRNRFEWLVPVLSVDAVFLVFLAAQAAVVFGGHDYLERTTGVTYADHVHQGFGQLTVATALTLLVAWAAARRAGDTPADRRWLRASLGLLCLLTLVVVASALYRMHVYQEAYGFTTLRLVVDVFEGWLGIVVLAVMVAGGLGVRRWLPRIALVTGAVALLGLAASNPDAWVAGRNIDRYQSTGELDLEYLSSLSADAAPVIAGRLPAPIAACALGHLPLNQLSPAHDDDWLAWNLGRSRARAALESELEGVLLPAPAANGGAGPCDELAARLDGAATTQESG